MRSTSTSSVYPQNTVVLHCVGRGKSVPCVSPFVLKLETYLRLAKIPYEMDIKKPFGPNGKMPWISFQGATMTDSQVIIDYLNKKLDKKLWGSATKEEIAVANLTRVALEEHFAWGLVHWRWVEGIQHMDKILYVPPFKLKLLKLLAPRKIKKTLHEQGLGRYAYDDMIRLVQDDLRNVSAYLGTKAYFLGEEMTEADCAIFGFLAQVLWAAPGSPHEKLIQEELTNLKDYCERVKEEIYPDWDELMFNGKPKAK